MWNFRWCRNLFSWFDFESRWLADNMVKQGFSKGLADWLGSNLRRIDTTTEEMEWIFNVDGAYDMFHSYRYWFSYSLTHPDADLQMPPVCCGSKRYLVHLPSGSAIMYNESIFEWSVSVFMVYGIVFQYLGILWTVFGDCSARRKTDYWSVLEQPPKGVHIEIVRASKSDRWTPDIMARLKEAESKKPGNVTYHLLENAGHWLHTDNPSGLIAIMAPILAKLSK